MSRRPLAKLYAGGAPTTRVVLSSTDRIDSRRSAPVRIARVRCVGSPPGPRPDGSREQFAPQVAPQDCARQVRPRPGCSSTPCRAGPRRPVLPGSGPLGPGPPPALPGRPAPARCARPSASARSAPTGPSRRADQGSDGHGSGAQVRPHRQAGARTPNSPWSCTPYAALSSSRAFARITLERSGQGPEAMIDRGRPVERSARTAALADQPPDGMPLAFELQGRRCPPRRTTSGARRTCRASSAPERAGGDQLTGACQGLARHRCRVRPAIRRRRPGPAEADALLHTDFDPRRTPCWVRITHLEHRLDLADTRRGIHRRGRFLVRAKAAAQRHRSPRPRPPNAQARAACAVRRH